MSSIQSYFAQNKSRRLVCPVAVQTVTLAQINSRLATASASGVGSLYSVPSAAALSTFVNGLDGDAVTTSAGEMLIDLGKEIVVGLTGVNSILLKFREVERTNVSLPATGNPNTVYVVVENNLSQSISNSFANRLPVKVSRV